MMPTPAPPALASAGIEAKSTCGEMLATGLAPTTMPRKGRNRTPEMLAPMAGVPAEVVMGNLGSATLSKFQFQSYQYPTLLAANDRKRLRELVTALAAPPKIES